MPSSGGVTPQNLPPVAIAWLASYTGLPERLAFEARKLFDAQVTAAIVEQHWGLQKARLKLPTLASYPGMLFPRVSVEQATPERIARSKFQNMEGDLAIDLTAGLGVDAWQLAQRFHRVVACEHDPALAEVLRHNFGQVFPQPGMLIEQADGPTYLANQARLPDLVYLDPGRRNATGRVVRWSALQPNPVACWPDVLKATRRWLVLKLSPLTDPTAALQTFPDATAVICRSLAGEVKEVSIVVDKQSNQRGQVVAEVFEPQGQRVYQMPETLSTLVPSSPPFVQLPGCWLWVPDAALRHSRLALSLALQNDSLCKVFNYGAYFVFPEKYTELAGNWWHIQAVLPRHQVREWLRAHRISQALIHALMLPERPEQLARKWQLRQNGSLHLVVVRDSEADGVVVCQ